MSTYIRTAYRHLILRHHPDRALHGQDEQGIGEARELNEAWEVLGDEETRDEYDQARRRAFHI
ncbi:Diphthamide biosynthesis protein 4 [Rhodotorula toruloides]